MILNPKLQSSDLQELTDLVLDIFNTVDYKFKRRGTGIFAQVTPRIKEICSKFLNEADSSVDWDFELFKSTKPTGLHNDVNYDSYIDSTCRRVMLLPVTWKEGMSPSTIVFNERYSEKKVFEGIKPGTLIDAATKEAIPSTLGNEFLLDEDFYNKWLGHCMKTSMTGLTVKSVELWEKGKAMIFDSDLLHASGKFDWHNGEWKICVLALGFEKKPSSDTK